MTASTMKVSTWNINQRSGQGKQIPEMIAQELAKQNSEIICLTEYVKKTDNHSQFCSILQTNGYTIFEDVRTIDFGNEILIAIKSDLVNDCQVITIDNDDNNPNFLQVRVTIEGQELNIIGVRIKIGGENIFEDFKNRKSQLDKLIFNLPTHENTIVLGDFNNGYYKQNDDTHSYQGKPREFYSYPLLKSEMNKAGLTVHTPSEETSWKYCKLDHIFANIPISNENYSWEFLKNADYNSRVGFPDHAILSASISL